MLLVPLLLALLTAETPPDAVDQPFAERIDACQERLDSAEHEDAVGKLRTIVSEIDTALHQTPNDAPLHFELGRARWLLDENESAVAAFDRAIALAPERPHFHAMKGHVLAEMGKGAEAEAAWAAACKLAPKAPDYWERLGDVRRGLKKFAGAIEAYDHSLGLDAKQPAVIYSKGVAQLGKGEDDAAIRSFQAVLELDPRSVNAHYNIGQTRQNRGEFDKALASFEAVIELSPDDWPAVSKAVQLCEALGKPERRDQSRERLMKLHADGKVDKNLYCRDQFKVGDRKAFALEYFKLEGGRAVRYSFHVYEPGGEKLAYKVSLGSYDYLTEFMIASGKIKPGERGWHLDRYFPDDRHETFGIYYKEPSYDVIKKRVVAIVEGRLEPVSSMTPAKDGGAEIELDP